MGHVHDDASFCYIVLILIRRVEGILIPVEKNTSKLNFGIVNPFFQLKGVFYELGSNMFLVYKSYYIALHDFLEKDRFIRRYSDVLNFFSHKVVCPSSIIKECCTYMTHHLFMMKVYQLKNVLPLYKNNSHPSYCAVLRGFLLVESARQSVFLLKSFEPFH